MALTFDFSKLTGFPTSGTINTATSPTGQTGFTGIDLTQNGSGAPISLANPYYNQPTSGTTTTQPTQNTSTSTPYFQPITTVLTPAGPDGLPTFDSQGGTTPYSTNSGPVYGTAQPGGTVYGTGATNQYPQRTSVSQSYSQLQSLLPKIAPIQGIDPNQFQPLQSFGDDYYNNLFGQAQKRLNDTYFGGDNSLDAQLKNRLNQRGLIGSGIEAGSYGDLYKDFGSQLADVSSNLASERAKNDIETENKNREFLYNLLSGNQQTSQFNAGLQKDVAGLGLAAAGDEARSSSQYAGDIFNYLTQQRNTESEQANEQIKIINDIIQNPDVHPDDKAFYSNLLGNFIGSDYSQFGTIADDLRDERLATQNADSSGESFVSGQSSPDAGPQLVENPTSVGLPFRATVGTFFRGTDGNLYERTPAGWAYA